jgi:hypothetical protein
MLQASSGMIFLPEGRVDGSSRPWSDLNYPPRLHGPVLSLCGSVRANRPVRGRCCVRQERLYADVRKEVKYAYLLVAGSGDSHQWLAARPTSR